MGWLVVRASLLLAKSIRLEDWTNCNVLVPRSLTLESQDGTVMPSHSYWEVFLLEAYVILSDRCILHGIGFHLLQDIKLILLDSLLSQEVNSELLTSLHCFSCVLICWPSLDHKEDLVISVTKWFLACMYALECRFPLFLMHCVSSKTIIIMCIKDLGLFMSCLKICCIFDCVFCGFGEVGCLCVAFCSFLEWLPTEQTSILPAH